MIRIAIVDDELVIANNISKITQIHADKLNITVSITVYNSGREFLNQYNIGDYDAALVLTDGVDFEADSNNAAARDIAAILKTHNCKNVIFVGRCS